LDEREAYVALNMMADIGPVSVRSLVAVLDSPQAIFQATQRELLHANGIGTALADSIIAQRDQIQPGKEIERAQRLGAQIITPVDAAYPKPLLQIHDPPLALYVFGTLEPGDKRAIGIVGSRHTTLYGRECAEKLSYQIVKSGFVVVSGLARGIDTAAHQGALKGGGRTLAVLGGALDCLYPTENADLARDIARHGAVLSEFPLSRKPDKTTFPMRNRIISGLSMGILVVEAGLGSGALITVNQALDQGRSVFAVPGRIDSPSSRGTHQLIKNGARLIESVDDILDEFEFLIPPGPRNNATSGTVSSRPQLLPEEERIVSALEEGEQDLDTLTRTTGLPAARVSALLIGLEMKRMVRMQPGRIVELIR